jgi:hypothetical protein
LTKTIRAITNGTGPFQAVQLRRSDSGYELLGVYDEAGGLGATDITVGGFDSGRAAFYRIQVPGVKSEQMASLVRMQAEALLPLPMDQMELAWRSHKGEAGKSEVTIAAARVNQLERYQQEMKPYGPKRIYLSGEAVVRVWRELFGGGEDAAVVMYVGPQNTHLCLSKGGRLIHALSSDIGQAELLQEGVGEASLQRLIQDVRHGLELFDEEVKVKGIELLSPEGDELELVSERLGRMGVEVRMRQADKEKLKLSDERLRGEVYRYLVPIGLGMMGMKEHGDELDLFGRWLMRADQGEKQRRYPSLKLTGPLAAAMLLAFMFVYGAIATARLTGKWESLQTEEDIDVPKLMREQGIKKYVASQRVDLLELLQTITACGPKDVMMDSFHFQKGQPMSIAAHTKNTDRIYDFREALSKHFDTVRVQNPTFDKAKKATKFTLTFDYTKTKKR